MSSQPVESPWLADKRSRGELDYHETTRNRKHTLQAKVERPRPRQKPKATKWQAPDDKTEMVFWAIDPNHSNLCGSSIGTRSGPAESRQKSPSNLLIDYPKPT
ncbi:hypothetical protein P9112_009906 [Eukaryota sp. TZLM1-RC]